MKLAVALSFLLATAVSPSYGAKDKTRVSEPYSIALAGTGAAVLMELSTNTPFIVLFGLVE
jgi:hypothetical protein